MASVFDGNILTRTTLFEEDDDSRILLLKTANTSGAIDSDEFLQFENTQGNHLEDGSNVLMPGTEQILILSGDQASDVFGNERLFIDPDLAYLRGNAAVAQPLAYTLTVGVDRQTLIEGKDLETGKNQTGFKQEYWDIQVTTNVGPVKVSYFVPTSTTQNSEGQHITFGPETLIQQGNRTLTRYATESSTSVGKSDITIQGNTVESSYGARYEKNYAGVNVEAVNGGTDFHVVLGAKTLYIEGFNFGTVLGSALTVHLENFIIQGIGTGAGLMKGDAVQTRVDSAVAATKGYATRIGTGALNILSGALSGTPRI